MGSQTGAACCCRPDAADDVSLTVRRHHDPVLRLWFGLVRTGWTQRNVGAHASAVSASDGVQRVLAAPVPIRARGMAVALVILRFCPTDADRSSLRCRRLVTYLPSCWKATRLRQDG